ncbi:MAG: ribosomal protein L7/L12 [Planctomycetes bacterium]|nr:ribosomal protein L7/L12 [Planctomycetota bacterium]
MTRKNRGSTRLILAGGGLIGLLAVIFIIMYLSTASLETTAKTEKHLRKKIDVIQGQITQKNKQINRMLGESYDVILQDPGQEQDKLIKAIQSLKHITANEAEEIILSSPVTILTDVSSSEAHHAKSVLTRAGATVAIRKNR